jgi:hypothetical protein
MKKNLQFKVFFLMQYIHLMFIFKLQRPIHPIQINIDKWILMKKPSYELIKIE